MHIRRTSVLLLLLGKATRTARKLRLLLRLRRRLKVCLRARQTSRLMAVVAFWSELLSCGGVLDRGKLDAIDAETRHGWSRTQRVRRSSG